MLIRSLTGLVLGAIIIISLIYSIWTATILLFIILVFSSMEWLRHFTLSSGKLNSTLFIMSILAIILFIVFLSFQPPLAQHFILLQILNQLLLIVLILFAYDLIMKKNWKFCRSWYSGIFYIGFSILSASLFLMDHFETNRCIILGFIFINWSNDVFAYFMGRLFGKHPLAPEISPKKTIEGSLGGMIAAIITAWLVNEYLFIHSYSVLNSILLGFSIWIAGTLGDLYESKMKRIANIKDSGTLLPGHGGFLDRFDSFFFIIPVGIFVLTF